MINHLKPKCHFKTGLAAICPSPVLKIAPRLSSSYWLSELELPASRGNQDRGLVVAFLAFSINPNQDTT